MTPEQQKALAIAKARQRMAAQQGDQSRMGSILPISRDASGDVSFDSDAGILGAIKRAFFLPGEVMQGEVDPLSPEGIGRAAEFATVVSPINPAVKAGERAIPGVLNTLRKAEVEPPTAEALKTAAKDAYETIRNMNVDYRTTAVNSMAGEIETGLVNDGIIAELAPKTFSILRQLSENPEGSFASIGNLEAARRTFANAAKDFANPTEQLAAKRAMESLDQFLARSDPATVQAGDPSQIAELLRGARGNYAAAKRSETLTGLEDAAQLRANAANSGQNTGNTARQRVASLLLNRKQAAQFGKEDLAGLRGVNEGSATANATRFVGNLLGGGGGLGAMLTGGAGSAPGIISGSPGLAAAGAVALPAIGRGSKELSNILTERALRAVERDTRTRSPLYEAMVRDAAMTPQIPERTAAIIRLLLSSGQSGGGGY